MTFISYAQNYEDVMLYRALKNIEKGGYVDVGANDPVIDSVTKAFYERGWRGINVEPIRHWYDKLMVDRPEDLNLNVAISDQPGILRLYDVQDTGLSTSNKDFAEKHLKELGFQYQEIIVPALTLDSVLQEFNREIHFLKVDVEGAEKQVLASIDLARTKPWIILAEATKPFSQEQSYKEWEALLINRGYKFVYFDGLNRFYVSTDKIDLIPAFGSPPNVFDDFIQLKHWNIQTALNIKEAERLQLETALSSKEAERLQLEAERLQLETALSSKEAERLQLETALSSSKQALSIELQNSKLEQQFLNKSLSSSRERVENLEKHSLKQNTEIQHWIDEVDRYQAERQEIFNSTSWRITAPVRYTKTILIAIFHFPLRVIKGMLAGSVRFMRAHPGIKGKLVRLFSHFPMIDRLILSLSRRVINGPTESPAPAPIPIVVEEFPNLALKVRQIHKDLLDAIEQDQKGR